MASSLCRAEAALGKIVAKMMLKPERCWVVWILFSSVTQIVLTFNQDVLKGEANGSRTFLQQVVLKPHEQAANVFIGATVKAVTASQVNTCSES
jgi:hypothetical protein